MNHTALITGASGGIGKALARIHASKGRDLVLVARNNDKLEALKNELEADFQVKVLVIASDLAKREAPKQIFDTIQTQHIAIEYLINNAGFGDYGFFHESDWKKEEQMIDLNMKSLTHLTKLFLPGMIKNRRGKIMNIASTAAFQPGPLMSVYYATKHYVLAFSEAIANEAKGFGVSVTALCPGPTASGFQNAAAMENFKLVNGKSMPSAEAVASYGYQAMMKGKTVAIHGMQNRILAKSIAFIPRNFVTKLVRTLQAPK
ncbi:SDR family oxidoreductase [Porifericola rhodea]|uniref:SDR family NAD(P)-dependent oxidoreductase n=1 Tax=Porifericola rhodea TaxID=930972 RepID=UPI002666E8E9|nr:SDR family oxidoreductase [Porifericola rhodea]WKN31949.1 SDR family oxidoreductase [Porifericola rhodea]